VLFRKYGAQYNLDPLMLAAQGYQESRLDQGAKSHVGAIGVIQIMPATGAELKVGDIRITEPDIHGGAKYMDKLMTGISPTQSSATPTGRCSPSPATTLGQATCAKSTSTTCRTACW
jgi:membrane-bound lytic murein transglycosylase MltF